MVAVTQRCFDGEVTNPGGIAAQANQGAAESPRQFDQILHCTVLWMRLLFVAIPYSLVLQPVKSQWILDD